MRQGEFWWANLPEPAGWRPVIVLSRDEAVERLQAIIVAPLTRKIRHVSTEVEVGPDQGLPTLCVISLDNLSVMEKDRLVRRIALADGQIMNQIVEALHAVFALPY